MMNHWRFDDLFWQNNWYSDNSSVFDKKLKNITEKISGDENKYNSMFSIIKLAYWLLNRFIKSDHLTIEKVMKIFTSGLNFVEGDCLLLITCKGCTTPYVQRSLRICRTDVSRAAFNQYIEGCFLWKIPMFILGMVRGEDLLPPPTEEAALGYIEGCFSKKCTYGFFPSIPDHTTHNSSLGSITYVWTPHLIFFHE